MKDIDLQKFDKNGKPLNLIPKADHTTQGNYYAKWLESNRTKYEPSDEDIKCELQLQALSSWEPLQYEFNLGEISGKLKKYKEKWVPYLRRDGISNDREGLSLTTVEGDSYDCSVSMPEIRKLHKRKVKEAEMMHPTELYHDLTPLHSMLGFFAPLGRTMLVKTNAGGWFPPHKDNPQLTRDTFRIVAFLSRTCASDAYEFEVDGRTWPIVPGKAYYVDTRKTHRTHSWMNNSIHLIINVPKTWENVLKLMSVTQNY
jgi:hypothetical protein